ncbi:hypothetical protein [Solidesulfovibrio fructosivorans]|uniref:hypothetical protein n=1 Tax=Solidesulfovibrio fructosivorans TaxID=878 RepID=UPI001180F6AC|nr:hypothetical protein [Solidesulfovibrio fructosivorans]
MGDFTSNERQIAMRERDRNAGIEYVQFRCEVVVMDVIRERAKKRGNSLAQYLRTTMEQLANAIRIQDADEQNTLQRQQPQK